MHPGDSLSLGSQHNFLEKKKDVFIWPRQLEAVHASFNFMPPWVGEELDVVPDVVVLPHGLRRRPKRRAYGHWLLDS